MTSRERVTLALNHKPPDRVPIDLGARTTTIIEEGYEKLKRYLNIKSKTRCFTYTSRCVVPDEMLLQRFGIDTRYVRLERAKPRFLSNKVFVDEWGIQAKKIGYYYERVGHPLKEATIKDLKHYKWPSPPRADGLEERTRYLYENTGYALILDIYDPMLEIACHLRGLQKFYVDLVTDQEFVHVLMEKLLTVTKAFYEEALDAVGSYIQAVWTADDLGHQYGLMMSPQLYRRMIKPYQRKLFQYIKSLTSAKLIYHSDGAIREIIPDLIEIGVNALNPIQVSANNMETKKLKQEFGNQLCFWGGIDTQTVLPFGNPEQVRQEIESRISDLAPGGGYVLASVHNIQPDVPPENVVAMFEAAKEFREYPIIRV